VKRASGLSTTELGDGAKSLPFGKGKAKVKRKGKVPFTKVPKKKYPFPVPIPPCSLISVRRTARRSWPHEVGKVFRIGYYGKADGLDCIWLVDESGKYAQTIDHECLHKFFKVESVSQERSLYGRGRPQFGPLHSPVDNI
jgi:hypothetical protein